MGRGPGAFPRNPGTIIAVLVALAGIILFDIFGHIVTLFQNLYQSSFLWLPGSRIGRTYWASVNYGLTMAALIGAFTILLVAIVILEVVRYSRNF